MLAAKKKEIEKKKSEVELMVNIGEGAPCPKCKQKLSREHISKVTQDFVRERCEIDDEISSLRQKIIQHRENKKEKDHFLKDLQQKDRELNDVKVRIGIITQKKIAVKSALVKLEEKISAKQEHIRVMQQENYAQEERKSLMAVSDELLKLSEVKSRYGQIFKLVSKYESEEVERLYVKHLQEVGRKMKIVNEIDKVDKSIFELKLEIGSYSNELIEQRKSYEQNKGVIEELELFEKQGEEQRKKISEKKETLAGVNTQLDNADSNLEQLKEEFRKKERTL